MNQLTFRWASLLALCSLAVGLQAQPSSVDSPVRRAAADLAQFERKAMLSKELGATHLLVTEGLPLATWEIDENDPYPMWFVHHASLLKIFPPPEVRPFVDAKYTAESVRVLTDRCRVLGKYGLKGIWSGNEPAVMPEAFFVAHPELRGPRIDQPNRARHAYFAPNVDSLESLRMYRESMQALLKACPQIELFTWVTTDAGSGFDWSPALYPGLNGNSNYKDRPLADRVSGFLINLQDAAKSAGHDIEISLRPIEARQWMIPTFSPDVLNDIIRKLPRGIAVEGREGPDGRPFAGNNGGGGRTFYPIVGVVIPSLNATNANPAAARVAINLGDAAGLDFNYRLQKFTRGKPMSTLLERLTTLRAFAASEVGEAQADNLVEAWSALNDVQRNLQVLNFGDVLQMGHVLNRWVTRPMVPFPEELTAVEKRDYRKFLFQAKGEDQANNLIDIQAMRMYDGWGAKMLFQRTIETTLPSLRRAIRLVDGIKTAAKDDAARSQWELMGKRLQATMYLLESADNMVAYQAQLDRVKALGIKPEANPVLGTQSSWDRTDLMESARKEIDTMVNLRRLLQSTKEPIFDLAPTAAEETPMRLGPDLTNQIQDKINIMNAHWLDYNRLFTVPNP